MTLDELASKEQHLIKKITDFNGDKNLISEYYDGIFNEYEEIHCEYVDIAVQNSDIEALKRAIFIQWFSVVEPEFLSGISQLDESAKLLALDELQKLVLANKIDEEFSWMLNCYYQIADFFVAPRSRYGKLVNYLEKMTDWDPIDAKKYSFQNRGRMGSYWLSRNDTGIFHQSDGA